MRDVKLCSENRVSQGKVKGFSSVLIPLHNLSRSYYLAIQTDPINLRSKKGSVLI